MSQTPHYNPDEEPTPEVPRNGRGGLPIWIVVICVLLFILGFWLFRQWRSQYVDYEDTFGAAEALSSWLPALGVLIGY